MSEMEIEKAVHIFEKIIDNVLAQKCELSNWETKISVFLTPMPNKALDPKNA